MSGAMNDINLLPEDAMGAAFVPPEFLRAGEDEYSRRDAQVAAMGKSRDAERR